MNKWDLEVGCHYLCYYTKSRNIVVNCGVGVWMLCNGARVMNEAFVQ